MAQDDINYDEWSKKELVERIEYLEKITDLLKDEKNENDLVSFPWIGNLGNWHLMLESNELLFNEKKITNLGYTRDEIPKHVDYEFFLERLHPDDHDRVMTYMADHLENMAPIYEVQYRIRKKNGDYIWYYDRGKVTRRDENGKPLVISGIVFDITKNKNREHELKAAISELKQLVIVDELTDAYNKRFMKEKITNEINSYKRNAVDFSLIMLDIDNFKEINDAFGHNIGDAVLKQFVENIQKRIRTTDVLARWGGDEFIILLPFTELKNALVVANDLKKEFDDMMIEDIFKVTCSIGVTSYTEGDTMDSLIEKADVLMYKSKALGKNYVSS